MELNIQKSKFRPSAVMQNGKLVIEGASLSEDCEAFYREVFTAFQKYAQKPESETEIEFHFDIIDCRSNRYIMHLLNESEGFYRQGNQLNVNWKFNKDDDAIKDNGEIIKSLIKVPFQLVEL